MNGSRSFKVGWLRGFLDGEGSVGFRKTSAGKNHTTYLVTVTNTDMKLLDVCGQYLNDLDIKFGRWPCKERKRRKYAEVINIAQAESIKRFASVVGFHAPEKIKKLNEVIAWITRVRTSVWESRRKEITRLWNEGHSVRCIAKRFGLSEGGHARFAPVMSRWGLTVNPQGKSRAHCCK